MNEDRRTCLRKVKHYGEWEPECGHMCVCVCACGEGGGWKFLLSIHHPSIHFNAIFYCISAILIHAALDGVLCHLFACVITIVAQLVTRERAVTKNSTGTHKYLELRPKTQTGTGKREREDGARAEMRAGKRRGRWRRRGGRACSREDESHRKRGRAQTPSSTTHKHTYTYTHTLFSVFSLV